MVTTFRRITDPPTRAHVQNRNVHPSMTRSFRQNAHQNRQCQSSRDRAKSSPLVDFVGIGVGDPLLATSLPAAFQDTAQRSTVNARWTILQSKQFLASVIHRWPEEGLYFVDGPLPALGHIA